MLADYSAAAPSGFWTKFPSRPYATGTSLVRADALRAAAAAAGFFDINRLDLVCQDLAEGADIGCRGAFRRPSTSSNAPSAFQCGPQVSDAVAGWVAAGFAAGPFDPALRPADVKINGIMCRIKPNGSARVILNLSAPRGAAVNEGIDGRLFPAVMSSTTAWLVALHLAGRKALMLKIDWSDAYKHVHVRPADLHLQWFSWLGRDFVETSLIFGAVSSAGVYDRLAKVVLDIALLQAKFPRPQACQYLDDLCAAASPDSGLVQRLDDTYRRLAAAIGVRLAPLTDPDKAFSACTAGVVLGISYDTVAWTWSIPAEKLTRTLLQLQTLFDADSAPQHEIWSAVGRILHYCPLVPSGRFNIDLLLRANAMSTDRLARVPLDAPTRQQFYFWYLMLRVCNGVTSIPPPPVAPPCATEFFTDAAGGAVDGSGRGSGGVGPNFWFVLPWGDRINRGCATIDGRKLSRKLSALELIGPLACLVAAPYLWRDRSVVIWVDNSGSVAIWAKGYSTSCALSNTLVKAMAHVAAAIGCRLFISKITRCSTTSASLADLLSKGRVREFRIAADAAHLQFGMSPASIPPELLLWVHDPAPDTSLGPRLLSSLGHVIPRRA